MPFGVPLAFPLGPGADPAEVEFAALLAAMTPGQPYGIADPTDPMQQAQCWAEACSIAIIWAVNERLEGALIPERMLEMLPIFEVACGLSPLPSDTLIARRAAVAARFLGYVGNSIANLAAICQAIAGTNFLGFASLAPTAYTVYVPGINPGPPGLEWSTNRAVLVVHLAPVQAVPAVPATYVRMIDSLRNQLRMVKPSWMGIEIGTLEPGGFLCGPSGGTVGYTLL